MKKVFLIYFLTVLSGIVTSVFVGNALFNKATEFYLSDSFKGTALQRMSYSIIIDSAVENIRAAKDGDTRKIMQTNCDFIETSIALIAIEKYQYPFPFEQQLTASVETGKQLIAELQAEGHCEKH